jgi:hypothetical protein
VNAEFEFHVPHSFPKPLADDSREIRQAYIEAKYRDRLFVRDNAPKSPQLTRSNSACDEDECAPMPIRKPPVPRRRAGSESTTVNGKTNEQSNDKRLQGMVLYDGMLTVCLLGGTGFKPSDVTTGLASPYCVVGAGNQELRSRCVPNTLTPAWKETLMLSWIRKDRLRITVWDKDVLFDDHMGAANVNLQSIPADTPITLNIPLLSKHQAKVFDYDWESCVVEEQVQTEHSIGAGSEQQQKRGLGKRLKQMVRALPMFDANHSHGHIRIIVTFVKLT